ncbi:MAG: hypothetical protein KatS3mg001_213 [Candidatus Pacearchaeota archaeon]|nr:MAG: hypothetical protein KatS3mg001_213 [Candidatus Pacearchaeota archaeon]
MGTKLVKANTNLVCLANLVLNIKKINKNIKYTSSI